MNRSWKGGAAVLLGTLYIARFAHGADPVPLALPVDLTVQNPPTTATGSYVPGKQNCISVKGGDGKGTLTIAGSTAPISSALGPCLLDGVTDCFVFTPPGDGAPIKGKLASGSHSLDITLNPGSGAPDPAKRDPSAQSSASTPIQTAFDAAVKTAGFPALAGTNPQNIYDDDKAVLFFDEKAKPLFLPLPTVSEDDTIMFVFVATTDSAGLQNAIVSKCTVATTVRVSGNLKNTPFVATATDIAPKPKYVTASASRCSSDGTTDATVNTAAGPFTASIQTIALYRITVGVSFAFDHTQVTNFNTATIKGGSVPVITDDTHEAGLQGIARVSLHLIKTDFVRPRFMFTSESEFWLDVVRAVANPMVGLSLSSLTNNLYLGDQIILYPGLGAVFGWHFYRQPALANGYQVGDSFPGGGSPPVSLRWTSDWSNWFVGVDVSTAILSQLLAALGK